jgi:hypothetical protein
MTKIPINVRRPLKYDPKQNVVRMTKIPINVSRPLKNDSKQLIVDAIYKIVYSRIMSSLPSVRTTFSY